LENSTNGELRKSLPFSREENEKLKTRINDGKNEMDDEKLMGKKVS
jgi:anti-sigma28 factor (negative regulator of flagellin synthesis)